MTDHDEKPPFYAKGVYRILSAAFGVLLLGIGVYALLLAGPPTLLSVLGALGLILLGGNLLLSAFVARESWLSKIGPLP